MAENGLLYIYCVFNILIMSRYLSRIEGSPPKRNVAGSIPVRDATSEWTSLHSDFFISIKKSVIRSVIPPFSQKGTLGSPVRL